MNKIALTPGNISIVIEPTIDDSGILIFISPPYNPASLIGFE